MIDSSQERYFYKGQTYSGAALNGAALYQPDVERRKVGLHMKVKPHINEKKFVLMEITQQIEDLGAEQQIGDQKWPTVLSREMSASISVQSRETVILGGLVKQTQTRSRAGIPFLYKIPLLGWLFQNRTSGADSDEVVVFITPYVLNTPEEIMAESVRRGGALDTKGIWTEGWSQSKLAEPMKPTHDQMEYEERILGRPMSQEERGGGKGRAAAPAALKAPAQPRMAPAKDGGVDPSVIEYMNSQEDRWGGELKKADERLKGAASTK